MTTKSKGQSIRQKLLNYSLKHKVPFQSVETTFLIERLVVRLSHSQKLSSSLVFKGGYVGLKVYHSHRYTIDLDALLVGAQIGPTLELVKKCASKNLDDGVWFVFEEQVDLTTQGEYGGIRQIYRAGVGEVLKNIKKAQIIHFDLGIGDPIVPRPEVLKTPSIIHRNEDISWNVYPIETIVAEKLHALVSHGDANSRSKDVYDLSIFLPKVDHMILKKAIAECFAHRGTDIPNFAVLLSNIETSILEKGWTSAMSSLSKPPTFKNSFVIVLNFFKGWH